MATFIPPIVQDQSLGSGRADSPEERFARHWAPEQRGKNVWKLNDGTYTERQPRDATTIAVTYYGGHVYTVTAAEAAALNAAGYTTS